MAVPSPKWIPPELDLGDVVTLLAHMGTGGLGLV